ncbi:MAG TPA: hypothetical protein VKQ72_10835 [Aggregatilineales bacterium]|nr:hypothetical protein [Aggregatilineales bacterium]
MRDQDGRLASRPFALPDGNARLTNPLAASRVPFTVAIGVLAFHTNPACRDLAGFTPAPANLACVVSAERAIADRAVVAIRQTAATEAALFVGIAVTDMAVGNLHEDLS